MYFSHKWTLSESVHAKSYMKAVFPPFQSHATNNPPVFTDLTAEYVTCTSEEI
jgi:hypothetical protein